MSRDDPIVAYLCRDISLSKNTLVEFDCLPVRFVGARMVFPEFLCP